MRADASEACNVCDESLGWCIFFEDGHERKRHNQDMVSLCAGKR
jgi:hypothetical protein